MYSTKYETLVIDANSMRIFIKRAYVQFSNLLFLKVFLGILAKILSAKD